MSVSYYLCKTDGNFGPVNTWQDNYAVPLDTPDNIKNDLEKLFPFVEWHFDYEWRGLGSSEKTHIDVSFVVTNDLVTIIVLRGGSPRAMESIMEHFNLNHCSSPDSEKHINPSEYNDDFELITE